MAYVCLLEVHLHLNDSHGLKEKRKLVHSLKAQARKRFGASVAEIDGHDTWQRSTLLFALVGGSELERVRRTWNASFALGVPMSARSSATC